MRKEERSIQSKAVSRRAFVKRGCAAAALAGVSIPHVHAADDSTIRLALIGCGGRGSGAVGNALSAPDSGPVKLHAMADLLENRLTASHHSLQKQFGGRIDVGPDRRFIGFEAYKQAIDALRPGDIAMLTGYAAWRPVQLEYAVSKGVNVFMEKSFACDPPAVRRVIRAGEVAERKGLKIAAGLMCRHSRNRQALIQRMRAGELGDIQLIRAYRMQPIGGMRKRWDDESELLYQIRNFTKFFWVSGGLYAEMDIHQIDEICWLKGELPVSAHGIGGRAPDSTDPSQNLDAYSIEYTFADGTKATMGVRYRRNCHNEFATYVHGTERSAQFSGNIHAGTTRIYKDQRMAREHVVWEAPKEPHTAWQAEWNVLLDNIRQDRPQNEARRAALTNLVDIMGRAAVHSGKVITFDQAMASEFQWCPEIDTLDFESEAPLAAGADGRYPAPSPGAWTEI